MAVEKIQTVMLTVMKSKEVWIQKEIIVWGECIQLR
jgi:hypothetical protein